MPHVICQYCSHRNGGAHAQCAHCGAPLPATAEKAQPSTAQSAGHPLLDRTLRGAEEAASDVARTAEGAGKEVTKDVAKLVTERLAGMSWRTAAACLVALALAAILIMRSCGGSPQLPSLEGLGGGGPSASSSEALPATLREVSSCRSADPTRAAQTCVVDTTAPLLAGIAGGRSVTYSLQRQQPNQVADTIARWRSAGASVVTDSGVFAAVGPSATAWYADPQNGIRLETSAFVDRSGARTFLQRSGLAR